MAQRRMFNKSITNSSRFIMMPPTSRLLYYDLGMNADDDGFCEHFVIMKMTDATPDDLRVLQARGLVKVFDDKVLIIQEWKENNYLQKDRYTPSKYLEIYKEELKLLVLNKSLEKQNGQPKDNQMDKKCIQVVNTDKIRLDKIRLDKISIKQNKVLQTNEKEINDLINLFKEVNPSYQRLFGNKTQRSAMERLLNQHGIEKIRWLLEIIPKTNRTKYAPTICTPLELENKLGQLMAFIQKEDGGNNEYKVAKI